MDMQQLFAAAQQMQGQLMSAQQALADAEVTGTAGGGLVKATVNGQGELLDLSIQQATLSQFVTQRVHASDSGFVGRHSVVSLQSSVVS